MSSERVGRWVDAHLPLQGRMLPRDPALALANALLAELPWLAEDAGSAVHPPRLVDGGDADHGLLPARARLVLRLRRERVAALDALRGCTLSVEGCTMTLGTAQVHELLPHGTLFSAFVDAGETEEPAFLARAADELEQLAVDAELICGRLQHRLGPAGPLRGYGLMLHGLRPDAALRVLEHGLGAHRLLGCGVFVPHRSAAAVGTAF